MVLYRYFRYVLLLRKAISKVLVFSPKYLEIGSHDSMFTPAIIKTWDPIHFQQCGWYLDCPLKKPPPIDIALRDSIQPLLPSPTASVPGSESLTSPVGGSSKSNTTSKGNRPRGSKRKAVELVEEPMDEDIPVTGCDPPTEVADPINSRSPRPVPLKRIQRGVVDETDAFKFIPPGVKTMSSIQAYNSSFASPWIFILDDSFHMMLDYKAKHNKFPSSYDDMVAFLNEVHIQTLFLCHSSILKFFLYLMPWYFRNYFWCLIPIQFN